MYDHRHVVRIIVQLLHGVVSAFQFLTRIPIPISVPFNETVGKRSTLFYPLVGFVLGLFLVVVGIVGLYFFHPAIVAVAVITCWVIYSGGLHLDGVMDTADALYSNKNRDEMLHIMRDSRIGAMGALHAIFVILWKVIIVYSMLETDVRTFAFCLVAIPVISRLLLVWVIANYPYARGKEGMGAYLQHVGRFETMGSSCIALLLLGLSGWLLFHVSFTAIIVTLIVFMLVASLFVLLIARLFKRKLGGFTGDTYGYMVEMVEVLLLVAAWMIVT